MLHVEHDKCEWYCVVHHSVRTSRPCSAQAVFISQNAMRSIGCTQDHTRKVSFSHFLLT
jgi:hypothetical protein